MHVSHSIQIYCNVQNIYTSVSDYSQMSQNPPQISIVFFPIFVPFGVHNGKISSIRATLVPGESLWFWFGSVQGKVPDM